MNAPERAALLSGTAAPAPVWARPIDGAYYDMPAEEYHAVEAMSFSGSEKILRSPAHFKLWRTEKREPLDSQLFGQAVHCGVLESAAFVERVLAAPEVNRRTTVGKLAWSDFCASNAGRVILKPDDFDRARRCIDAVLDHPTASRLLATGAREVSLFWTDGEYKVPCKARLDAINDRGGISDLKTYSNAEAREFARQVGRMGYHRQGAHYWSGHEHVMHASPAFFAFVVVEDEQPHGVACYELPPVALQSGRRDMDEALARYRAAIAAGAWRGYPEAITAIDLPRYALRDHI